MDEADWERLIEQLRAGHCTPFLGAGACDGTLPSAADMSDKWAADYKYPFMDGRDLARVMQYAATTVGDAVHIKEKVCDDIKSAGPPDFSDPEEPHALLAEFPIPVFVTTNYDDFLARALTRKGKMPSSVACPWYRPDKEPVETLPGFEPTADRPLIYHLHGSTQSPRSLVLTELDYLDFLIRISKSQADDTLRIIPTAIESALTDSPLLFIGYSLKDWTFRVLFHSLLRTTTNANRRRSVSVQLVPEVGRPKADAKRRAQTFMSRYFDDWRISIFWGTGQEFCHQLRSKIGP